jgi:4-hydroxy-2-oxoheptanedioate aldolase
MNLSNNPFKAALRDGAPQIGLWVGLADAYVTELLATTGFDWVLLAAEHAPNDVRNILPQLQAAAAYPVHCVVRSPVGDTVLIKQYLDLGAQTLLIPMVENAEQAAAMVRAKRYPPHGIRGVGSALARSSRWNRIDGYLGNPGAPAVQDAIEAGVATVLRAKKAVGILTADIELARSYLKLGATFVAVGVDTTLTPSFSYIVDGIDFSESPRPPSRNCFAVPESGQKLGRLREGSLKPSCAAPDSCGVR